MINLDNEEEIKKIDRAGQLRILQNWPEMILEARKKGKEFNVPQSFKWKEKTIVYKKPSNVVICGMGGSAIAGDYLITLYKEELSIPVVVNREYTIPNFVNSETLVICISYSGNTEETLSCFYNALLKHAMIINITSGGILEELSNLISIPYIKIQGGLPPRTALPLTYIPLITIFEKFNLTPDFSDEIKEVRDTITQLSDELKENIEVRNNQAKKLALQLYNTLPIFLGSKNLETVAYRAKCQLNENSKLPAISEALPESNHNGIVIWDNSKVMDNLALIFIRNKEEDNFFTIRIETMSNIVKAKNGKIINIYSRGKSKLAQQLSTTYIIDYTSIYLAILENIDPTITPGIDTLKKQLKQEINYQKEITKKIKDQ